MCFGLGKGHPCASPVSRVRPAPIPQSVAPSHTHLISPTPASQPSGSVSAKPMDSSTNCCCSARAARGSAPPPRTSAPAASAARRSTASEPRAGGTGSRERSSSKKDRAARRSASGEAQAGRARACARGRRLCSYLARAPMRSRACGQDQPTASGEAAACASPSRP